MATPPRRRKRAQFNVRQADDVKEKFVSAMERLRTVVQKAGGGPLTQAALVEYWSVWFSAQAPGEQENCARMYRDAYRARLDRIEAEARKRASEGNAVAVAGQHGGVAAGMPLDQRPADEQDEPTRQVKSLPKVRRGKKV